MLVFQEAYINIVIPLGHCTKSGVQSLVSGPDRGNEVVLSAGITQMRIGEIEASRISVKYHLKSGEILFKFME